MKADERLIAGLTHLSIFLHGIGIFVALAIYILQKDKSAFVARHAMQSLMYQIMLMIGTLVLGFFGITGMTFGMMGGMIDGMWAPRVTLFGHPVLFFMILLFVFGVVFPLLACVRGFQGREYRYPLSGRWASRLV